MGLARLGYEVHFTFLFLTSRSYKLDKVRRPFFFRNRSFLYRKRTPFLNFSIAVRCGFWILRFSFFKRFFSTSEVLFKAPFDYKLCFFSAISDFRFFWTSSLAISAH